MSAEDIIRRHRQRLEEHRRYLDKGLKPSDSPRATGDASVKPHTAERTAGPYGNKGVRSTGGKPTSQPLHRNPQQEERYSSHDAQEYVSNSARSGGGGGDTRGSSVGDEESPRGRHLFTTDDGARYFTDEPTRVFDRNHRWMQHRNKSLEVQRQERTEDGMGECTFHPRTHHSPSASRSRRADPYYATADDSSTNHVIRQRQARNDRQQRESRLTPDIEAWENRQTVPEEFRFGQKGAIGALKKPVAWTPNRAEKDAERAHRRSASAKPTSTTPSKPAAARAPAATRTSHSVSVDAVQKMEKKITSQELEIARLNGLVSSLKRELDVAKGKVRQLALAQHASNQFLYQ